MKKQILFILISVLTTLQSKAQWTALNSGTLDFIESVNFPVSNIGYFATDQSHVEKTTDGGSTWNQVGPTISIGRTYFLTATTGFGYWGSRLYKTTTGGTSWVRVIPDSLWFVASVEFPSALIGYAIAVNKTSDSALTYKTINGGNTWAVVSKFPSPGSDFYETSFTSTTTGYLICDFGTIYKTTNGGVTWVFQTNTGMSSSAGIHFPAIDTGYVTGSDLFKTVNGGITWTQVPNPFPSLEYSIHFFSTKVGFVCGGNGFNQGFIYKTINSGVTWTLSNSNANTYQQMSFVNSNEGYASGTNGLLMKYNGVTGEFDASTSLSMTMDIYPNPSIGKFEIASSDKVSKIDIYSELGELVYSSNENMISNCKIDLANKPAGIYFVKIIDADGNSKVNKIVVQ